MPPLPATTSFRQLHDEGILLLPNAWDAGTARLVESLGAKAIATTSAGVAWANGYADGDQLPVPRLMETVSAIINAIRVPLTIDIEGGYSDDPQIVAGLVTRLAGMGVCGINLEDGRKPPELLCAKIDAIRRACAHESVDVFINARTDVYLQALVAAEERVDETLRRARAYREAGADGLFVPGASAQAAVIEIVAGAGLPLNLLARAALPDAQELQRWGVRRLSAGADLAESAYQRIADLARGFLQDGLSAPLSANAMPYPDLNALFARPSP
ncbi:isocitrate lyase/PEP mutase family protein [Lysobacter fragariae]